MSDVESPGSGETSPANRTRRTKFAHLEPLPDGWHIAADDVMEPFVSWLRKSNSGWVERSVVNETLGIHGSPEFRFDEFLNIPSVSVPKMGLPALFPPITFEEAAGMVGFSRLLQQVFGENFTIAMRCILSDSARAAALSTVMGK